MFHLFDIHKTENLEIDNYTKGNLENFSKKSYKSICENKEDGIENGYFDKKQ